MNDNEITRQLIVGSHNIDRMRKEIVQVVAMIKGFLSKVRFGGGLYEEKFGSDEFWWVVKINLAEIHAGRPAIIIECWPPSGGAEAYYSSFDSIELRDVEVIHKNLPLFVGGMLRTYPELHKMAQPILNASQAFVE